MPTPLKSRGKWKYIHATDVFREEYIKGQCWETSREYNRLNGPTAFPSSERICRIFVCVQMGLISSFGVRWRRFMATYTCWWPIPCHSSWLMFACSIDLREGVSSSISLLSELLLSSWLWIIVNNCNAQCNVLGQAHVVRCEYSENWERWAEVADTSHLAENEGLNLPVITRRSCNFLEGTHSLILQRTIQFRFVLLYVWQLQPIYHSQRWAVVKSLAFWCLI